MKQSALITRGVLHALGLLAYVAGVAWVMSNAERWIEPAPEITKGMAFLTLFVLSAAITGTLVLGKPILLFLSGQKKDALTLFGATIVSIVILLAILFVILSLMQ